MPLAPGEGPPLGRATDEGGAAESEGAAAASDSAAADSGERSVDASQGGDQHPAGLPSAAGGSPQSPAEREQHIQFVVEQVFSSLLCGVDPVGVSASCTPDWFIPLQALAAIPAIADQCRVPGALLAALRRSPMVEMDSSLTMARPVMQMQPAPMPDAGSMHAHSSPVAVPMPAPAHHQHHAGYMYTAPYAVQPVAMGPGGYHHPHASAGGSGPAGWYMQQHPGGGGVQYYIAVPQGPPPSAAAGFQHVGSPGGMTHGGSPYHHHHHYHAGGGSPGGIMGRDHAGHHQRGGKPGSHRGSAASSPGGDWAGKPSPFRAKQHKQRRSRHNSYSSVDEDDDATSNDITTRQWLKIIRLHKYTSLLEGFTRRDLLDMPDEELGKMPITDGARRKLRIELARWAQAHGLDVPFSIPPSASPSRPQSRDGSRDTSRAHSRESSRPSSMPGSRCSSFGPADMRRPGNWHSGGSSGRSSVDDAVAGTLLSAAKSLEGMRLAEDSGGSGSAAAPQPEPSDASAGEQRSGIAEPGKS